VTGVGGTLPNWVKRNPNPVPALQNWWANVASTAKRLREKVKKGGADVSEELAEAEAEDETVPEAIKKFKSLLRIIDNVKNFNPKESAKLVELGNRLSGYQSGISEGLKRIKIPGRIKRLVGKDADGVVNAAEGAEETALEIERELSKWGNLKGWLSSRTQNINLRGKLASARQKVAEEVKRKIRRK
jgi:DNA repair ATPase RecN